MKFLDLIHPRFGAVSICDHFIGDFCGEYALDRYDKDGRSYLDASFNLSANLDLEDIGFDQGSVRFNFDSGDDSISDIVLDICFEDHASLEQSGINKLYGYLSESGYFDDCSKDKRCWTFRNGINEIFVEVFDEEFTIQVYSPSATGIEPKENYETGVLRTVSHLAKGYDDEWEDYLNNSE